MMSNYSIAVEPVYRSPELTRQFGAKRALGRRESGRARARRIRPRRPNGSGKTSSQAILGLLRAQAGSARLRARPRARPAGVLLASVASLKTTLAGWMRVDELIRYTRAFTPAGRTTTRGTAAGLRARLGEIKTLSRANGREPDC